MIDSIRLKFGPCGREIPLEFNITPITVFVGPNNSGKSLILKEIELISKGVGREKEKIIEQLEYSRHTEDEILAEIEKMIIPNPGNVFNRPDVITLGGHNTLENNIESVTLIKDQLVQEAQNPNINRRAYTSYLKLNIFNMGGENRVNLLKQRPVGDLKKPASHFLMRLFKDDELRSRVRSIIYDAFGKYFVIDATDMGNYHVRLSENEPKSNTQEKSLEEECIQFHKSAMHVLEMGDGVRAFTGIIAMVLAGEPKLFLIDEPEAFLHPSLSHKLGKELSKSLRNSDKKRLFASTHSANFLMGCIQSGTPMNIVRLSYKNNIPTARLLSQDRLLLLMRNPLLRSVGVLNGLFYDTVVVTEGDSDRAFYQEINERLLSEGDSRGIPNCLFLNAQNKQTVPDIVLPLRQMGIPAVGIVDIDFIKDGRKEYVKHLKSYFFPDSQHKSLQTQRQTIYSIFDEIFKETAKNMKKDGGVLLLSPDDREACTNYFESLSKYGLFIVPSGEVESWLKSTGSSGHGSGWLIQVFEKMGSNPDEENYMRPSKGDVWDFIGNISKWVSDPNRKGIPSAQQEEVVPS